MAGIEEAKQDAMRIIATGQIENPARFKRLMAFLRFHIRHDSEAAELYDKLSLLNDNIPPRYDESAAQKTMAEPQKTPSLATVFIVSLMQLYPSLIKKPLFGKPRLPLANFLTVGGYLYETGAALGWAYQDSQLAFERVLASPETPGQSVRFMRLKAKERMAEGKSQDMSLADFFYKTEVARLGLPMDWNAKGLGGLKRLADWLQKQQSLDLNTARFELQIPFYEGVGYGFEFPEETQRRWKASYEKTQDLIEWRFWYQHGLHIPPEPPPIQTWDERVSELKAALREYITKFMPALTTLFAE
jgi:hypothetical protein